MALSRVPRKAPKRPSAAVIDVGDKPTDDTDDEAEPAAEADPDADPDAEPETDPEADPDADPDLLAADVIDVGDDPAVDSDGDERLIAKAVKRGAKADKRGSSLAVRDPMAAYMNEARRFPLLTPEEEHSLAVRLVEHGDTGAARKLVEANLRLVVKIAYEYRRAHRNLLDLVQEGNVGLMQAVSKYDPYRGVKLSSYAAYWIRAYMLKFILNNWRLVKIGTTQAQRKLFFNLRKERERLEQQGFDVTTARLAESLDVTEREVIDMERRLAAPEASLDAPVGGGDDDGTRTRMDYMVSDGERPDTAVAQSEFATLLRAKLETFAATLDGREETIFRERWLTEDPQTLQEIGDKYGVSRERARQLEKRMLLRLRKYLEAELGTAIDIDAMVRE